MSETLLFNKHDVGKHRVGLARLGEKTRLANAGIGTKEEAEGNSCAGSWP